MTPTELHAVLDEVLAIDERLAVPVDWTQRPHLNLTPDYDFEGIVNNALEQQKRILAAIASTVETPYFLLVGLEVHASTFAIRLGLQRFRSYQQAQAVHQGVNHLISRAIELPALRERYTSTDLSLWADLRVQIAETITQQLLILPKVKHVNVGHHLPALVIAHRLYQDAEKAGDIVIQNQIIHPGFCEGELEYLQ